MTTTGSGTTREWTAVSLRPTARWVPVTSPTGRLRMEMVWAVPAVTVPSVTGAAPADRTTGSSAAA